MLKKRGQASVEYTLMVGIALILIMPLIVIAIKNQADMKDDINVIQARKVVESIADNADKVYFIGEPSKTTINARFPENIENIDISGKKISFFIGTSNSVIEVYKYTNANLSGSIETGFGLKDVVITAQEDYVNISLK